MKRAMNGNDNTKNRIKTNIIDYTWQVGRLLREVDNARRSNSLLLFVGQSQASRCILERQDRTRSAVYASQRNHLF